MVLATFTEMHLLLLLVIVFLLFGGKKLPELARGLGEAMKEFKRAQRDIDNEMQRPANPPAPTPTPQASQPVAPGNTDPHKPA